MIYSHFYWRIGFKSRLYDLLMPEVYLDSMRRIVEWVPTSPNAILLDAGCGSGLIIKYLKSIKFVGTYIGLDILLDALINTRKKAGLENILDRVYLAQSDLTQSIPLSDKSVDTIIAHFSLYTIRPDKRSYILKEFRRLLRRGGILVLVEPSPEYSAKRIIKKSKRMISFDDGITKTWIKKWILYPLTYQFGLKFIERQLKNSVWRASSGKELCDEMSLNGYKVKNVESVYANSATLIILK